MNKKLVEVPKEKFDEFLNEYLSKNTVGVSSGMTMICEPPFRSYRNDNLPTQGELGSIDYFFDKEFARISYEWMGPKGEVDNSGKYFKYFILKEQA